MPDAKSAAAPVERKNQVAVPKKRVSKTRKAQRRSHDALKPLQLMTEPESGLVVPRRFWRAAKQGLARIGAKR